MTDIPWTISSMGQLSILLEASSPKPGNVNRLQRFSDTGYRHFLASASLMGKGLHNAAKRGVDLAAGRIKPSEVKLGKLIFACSEDVFTGLNKRNTILGTVLLYIPIVVCASAAIHEDSKFTIKGTKKWLRSVIDATTFEDSIEVYRAFHVSKPGGDKNKETMSWTSLHDRYDIDNPQVYDNISEDGVTLQELFKASAEVDSITKEWSDYFDMTLSEIFPHLDEHTKGLEDLEEGIVKTFVWLLSQQPDGLIVKKAGEARAEEVRALAQRIIEENPEGETGGSLMTQLDEELRKEGNLLNPGTTADLVSAAILCKLIAVSYP
ncbi:MAG: triphosphoribosyl-dephospho-CoA synthase [Candidatus Thorarchaeota archaeon]|jgi:triphosphoribosyl-dephospho-CoA synthase